MYPDTMPSFTDLYFGSVSVKRQTAYTLFKQHGNILFAHSAIQQQLHDLVDRSSLLSIQMASMGMNEVCRNCGSKPGGGCCSNFMAGETDGILLLINLMLGVDVKVQHNDTIECCYLGKKGCVLKVKPIFCLNYNCRKISQGNPEESLTILNKVAGRVLCKLVEIEEAINKELLSFYKA